MELRKISGQDYNSSPAYHTHVWNVGVARGGPTGKGRQTECPLTCTVEISTEEERQESYGHGECGGD